MVRALSAPEKNFSHILKGGFTSECEQNANVACENDVNI